MLFWYISIKQRRSKEARHYWFWKPVLSFPYMGDGAAFDMIRDGLTAFLAMFSPDSGLGRRIWAWFGLSRHYASFAIYSLIGAASSRSQEPYFTRAEHYFSVSQRLVSGILAFSILHFSRVFHRRARCIDISLICCVFGVFRVMMTAAGEAFLYDCHCLALAALVTGTVSRLGAHDAAAPMPLSPFAKRALRPAYGNYHWWRFRFKALLMSPSPGRAPIRDFLYFSHYWWLSFHALTIQAWSRCEAITRDIGKAVWYYDFRMPCPSIGFGWWLCRVRHFQNIMLADIAAEGSMGKCRQDQPILISLANMMAFHIRLSPRDVRLRWHRFILY